MDQVKRTYRIFFTVHNDVRR